jgi:hypothetical protein
MTSLCTGGGEEDVLHYQVAQLSVSPENTILHYLHLDVGEVRGSLLLETLYRKIKSRTVANNSDSLAEPHLKKDSTAQVPDQARAVFKLFFFFVKDVICSNM